MGLAFPKPKNADFKLVGEGLYLASLKHIGEPEKKTSEKYGDSVQVRLVWLIEGVLDDEEDNEEFIGEEVWDFCTWSTGKKAKLRARIDALLGRPFEDDEDLNVDDVLGKRVKLNVEHYTKGNGDTGQKVASALAYRTKKKRRPVEDDEDGDEIPF